MRKLAAILILLLVLILGLMVSAQDITMLEPAYQTANPAEVQVVYPTPGGTLQPAGPGIGYLYTPDLTYLEFGPLDARIIEIVVTFSHPMNDTAGDPTNYRIYEAGPNGVIDSTNCTALSGDDLLMPINVVGFTTGDKRALLRVNNGSPLPVGEYAFVGCDTLMGMDGRILDGDADGSVGGEDWRSFSVVEPVKLVSINNVQNEIATPLNNNDVLNFPFGTIDFTYSKEVLNIGDIYLLTPGPNGHFDTEECLDQADNLSDDQYIDLFLVGLSTPNTYSINLTVNPLQEPGRLFICNTVDRDRLGLDVDNDDIGGDNFILNFEIRRAPQVVSVTSDAGDLNAFTTFDIQTLTIIFDESMADPIGDGATNDITNPSNYRLLDLGADHELQSGLCGAVLGDDIALSVDSVIYEDATSSATIAINDGNSLIFGTYRIVVCATVEDAQGMQLDGNGDALAGDPYSTSFVFDVAQSGDDLSVNTTGEAVVGNCGIQHCSFREAILAANGIDAVVTIHLQSDALYEITTPYVSGGFVTGRGLPLITASVIIKGNGATLQRSYVSDTPEFGLLGHDGSTTLNGFKYTTLTVEDLTFKNSLVSGAGGAVGGREVYIYDCNFIENEATTGGALYASTELIVERSYFLHNRINIPGSSPRYGGAIYTTASATISHSIFEENFSIYTGGAIGTNNFGQVIVENNLFIRNEAKGQGTAIWMRLGEHNHIRNNTFIDNGTINLSPDSNPGSTVVLYRADWVEITHNTFADSGNLSIAITVSSDYTKLFGNIITGNGSLCYDDGSDDRTASNASIGYNVSTSPACLSHNLDNGDVLGDPQLGTLGNHGGPTQTMDLGVTSPALDIIPEVECLFSEDQRGIERPLDGDGDGILGCDAGAFESLTLGTAFFSDLSLTLIEPTTLPPDGSLYTVRAVLHNDGPIAAENVAVVFDGDHAYTAVDSEFFASATGRWQPGNILPGKEVAIDVVFRVDRDMKGNSLTLFGEVERNLNPDLDSTPDNGNLSEDDYDSLTLTVACSVVPEVIAPGDIDGIVSAIYAANDESCNPGPDAFSLSPNATYMVYDYYFREVVNSHSEYTAFPLVDSNIAIDGQGSVLDFDAELIRVTPTRFFYTLQGSRLTLNNMTFQNAHGVLVRGTVIKSQGDLYLHHVSFLHNFRDASSYSSYNLIHHTIGSLLVQDSYFEANNNNHNVIEIEDAHVARIERSTFYHNRVVYSVVESINTSLDVINSTFVENDGKSINNFESGSVTVDQSTFYGNASALNSQTPTIVRNSIFSPGICSYYYGAGDIISEGNNVLQDTSLDASQYLFNCGFDHSTDLIVEDVRLLPLASYNGSTPIMRPASDSPALDIIPPESCNAAVDQRLVARPFNRACDAGAVELALDESFGIPDVLQLADVSDNTIVLALPAIPSEEVNLQLERLDGTGPAAWSTITLHSFGESTHVDTGLVCGQTYQYRASYISDAGVHLGQPSTALEVTTLPCERPVTHTFGLYKSGQWLFYTLDGDQRYDARFNWGPLESEWQAVIGDWNGDGIDGIGLYKDGQWLLRSVDISGNVTDTEFVFGDMLSGAVALAGDWNGDGIDTIGLFQNGFAYLHNSNSLGAADLELHISSTTSVPIVGDWNGDGIDTIGIYENTSFSLTMQNVSPITIQTTFSFGPLNWLPLAGDWNDDNIDTVGIYNQGLWRMRNSNASGSVDVGFNYGNLESGWQPLGNFDSSPAILNLLFAATVPTPRVPVIPGPEIPIPTDYALDSQLPSVNEVPAEPTFVSVATSMPIASWTPEPSATKLANTIETTPTVTPTAINTLASE